MTLSRRSSACPAPIDAALPYTSAAALFERAQAFRIAPRFKHKRRRKVVEQFRREKYALFAF